MHRKVDIAKNESSMFLMDCTELDKIKHAVRLASIELSLSRAWLETQPDTAGHAREASGPKIGSNTNCFRTKLDIVH